MKKLIVGIFIYYIISIIILHIWDWQSIGCPNCGYKGDINSFCPHCGYEVINNG